jgi:heme A synthase
MDALGRRARGIGLLLSAVVTAGVLVYVVRYPSESTSLHPGLLVAYLLFVIVIALVGARNYLS